MTHPDQFASARPLPVATDIDLAFQLLDGIQDRSIFVGPASPQTIAAAEAEIGVRFPGALRQFLGRHGAVGTRSEFSLYGLGVPTAFTPSLVWAWRWLEVNSPSHPPGLLPVGPAGRHRFACLAAGNPGQLSDTSPIYVWDLEREPADQPREILAPSYPAYLRQVAWELKSLDIALTTLRGHIESTNKRFGYEHDGKGKLPRNDDWRPYRFCSQDIVLGAHVQRHVRGENYLQVDVFLPIDVYPFEPGSSLLGMTVSILADAYRCGGTMEIRFTKNADGGQFPRKLEALAESLGVPIKPESLGARRLNPEDSRRLFLALTDFSPRVRERLAEMSTSPERACYAVQRGIWPKPEAEAIILSYPLADRVFAGGAPPEQRMLFQQDLVHARAAILAGYLDRGLALRERAVSAQETLELEDDIRLVETAFHPQSQVQTYSVRPAPGEESPAFRLPWLGEGCSCSDEMPFGKAFLVLLRARPAEELALALEEDLAAAATLQESSGMRSFVLLPQDYYSPSLDDRRPDWIRQANDSGVGILICAQTLEGLDDEAYRRLVACRIFRE